MKKISKSKKGGSRSYFHTIRQIAKSKRSEGAFGLSIGMIWAIILMIFFVAATFMVIRYFIIQKDDTMMALSLNDLANDVNTAFNSPGYTGVQNYSFPSGVQYLCFVNFSGAPKDANSNEIGILSYMKEHTNYLFKNNVFVYSPDKDYTIKYSKLKNIAFERNPYCIKAKKGIISVKIERTFEDPNVWLS